MSWVVLWSEFEERVREIDLFFSLLQAEENGEIAVTNNGTQQVFPVGRMPPDCGKMLKGTAYLLLYNLVEAFMRRGFQEVFNAIEVDAISGAELSSELLAQWVEQKNRKVKPFVGSPKLYMEMTVEIVSDIVLGKTAKLHRDRLPFSGNLDAAVIRDVCSRHGVTHVTTPASRGGDALATIRINRNLLAHGDESFANCGGNVSLTVLSTAKTETVQYMRDILGNLEAFTAAKRYRTAPPAKANTGRVP